ncbi:hypothetical protein TNCV_1799101 [Trichonephila clavipes]|uniref:Uncharacterized protein n=1 Tax=Trichonephila clavipes TaxID=2585209 RepID=A0A8X6VLM4_TRICX|nr:hypothetical protein TNCV_1799101 [Trichonephila clavipes]
MASSCASRCYTNSGRSASSPKQTAVIVDVLWCCELFRLHEGLCGDGTRNFEPRSSDEDNIELAPPLLPTTPLQREDVRVLDRFNVHRSSGTGLELTSSQPRVRYVDH